MVIKVLGQGREGAQPLISALGRRKLEDWEFQISLSYAVRACLKKQGIGWDE